jgi:hypothetical protein
MKALKFLCLVLVASAFLTGCKKSINYDEMAKATCNCAGDWISIMEKVKAAEGNVEELTALTASMAENEATFTACMAEVEKKYPGIEGDAEKEAKADEALSKHCPKLSSLMNE